MTQLSSSPKITFQEESTHSQPSTFIFVEGIKKPELYCERDFNTQTNKYCWRLYGRCVGSDDFRKKYFIAESSKKGIYKLAKKLIEAKLNIKKFHGKLA